MSMKLLVCCVVKHTFAIMRWFACSHCVIIKHTESQISMIVYNQGYVIVHETRWSVQIREAFRSSKLR